MSKADQLGTGASFGRARPVSARRAAIGAATGTATLGVPDPTVLPLSALCHNPFNPREELTDLEETAESLRAKGQIQPVTVVRRAAFLGVHPGQEAALGDADFVVIDGNRRLAAAHVAGLEKLRVDVHDDLAVSAADILESALIANVHRVDVPPLDQARAIRELLAQHGSQEQVAKRLGKSGAWVSQRLALLELPEDLQEKVESGELTVKEGRRIGRLAPEEQREEAEKTLNRVKAPRKPRSTSPRGEHAAAGEDASMPHQGAGGAGLPEGTLNPVKGSGGGEGRDGTLNRVKGRSDAGPGRGTGEDSGTLAAAVPDPIADAMRVLLAARQDDAGAIADALGTTLDRGVLENVVDILRDAYLKEAVAAD